MNDATISRDDGAPSQTALDTRPEAPPGFELLDEVGRGGMGVVFRARDLALDREVAVKLLQEQFAPGSATAARFVEEARITGQLQHPGILAVYQVGTLPGGRPFLAMKLIKGNTLDALLKDHQRAREGEAPAEPYATARLEARPPKHGASLDPLSVFEAVCQAVGYAHAHGVIHRDLKPANVMVGSFGEVQVMDWGLAKVLTSGGVDPRRPAGDPEATTAASMVRTERDAETPFTQHGSVLGTPAFMAPEQAAGELDKIDARADVFGLGAILCVLLTGKPPFTGHDAESVRLAAVRGQTEEAFARLDGCGADPDVAALCKRCLAFELADRPASGDAVAAAVAALRRAADDRARQAERDKLSAEVRAAEQAKRRRAVLWAAGVVAAALLAGTAVATWQAVVATRAQQDALAAAAAEEKAKEAAQAKEAEAWAVLDFVETRIIAAARPEGQEGGLGKDVTLRRALEEALPLVETHFATQPLIEVRLRMTLGYSFECLGEFNLAAEQYDRARTLCTEHRGPNHPDTLRSMRELAAMYLGLAGRQADALRLYEKTLAVAKAELGPDHPDTLATMHGLANLYVVLGRYADAVTLHEATLALRRVKLGRDHPNTLWSMTGLANSYAALGRHAEGLQLRKEVLGHWKAKLGRDHPNTLVGMFNVAKSYTALSRHADALQLHEKALALHIAKLGPDHPSTLWSIFGVAESLVALDRGAEAIPLIDECVAKAAGKAVDPRLIPGVMNLRLQHFRKTGDPAGCRATAVMWEKLNRTDAGSLYDAARFRAVAAAVQAKDPAGMNPAARQLAQEDADRAMAWLTKAVAAGYKDTARMEKDADLDFLREREDFKKLLAEIDALDKAEAAKDTRGGKK